MKKCALLLAFVLLFGMLQAPLSVVNAVSQWDLLDCDLSTDYTTSMKVTKKTAGTVTQYDGYVNISKTDSEPAETDNSGTYVWLLPNTTVNLPADTPFTVEAAVRMAGPTTYRSGQVSARIANKLYPVFISYGTADDTGWIATTSGGGTNKVALDTTVWHNYALVVDHAALTYDVYVDGVKLISGAEPQSYSGGTLFRIGADNDARTNMDVKSVRIGTGDLSASLGSGGSQEPAPDPDILFEDHFDEASEGVWSVTNGTWTVQDGVYAQSASGAAMTFAGDTAWTNYSLEAKVTPVSTSKNIAVMISGRAAGANDRYIGAYNGGKLMIDRRIGGKSTILAQKEYTLELGTEYTLKMVFAGSKISLYVNGVLELEAADESHASGMIGLATYNTVANFDDVVVRSVTVEPDPVVTLSVTGPADYQVIQRDVAAKSAQVAVSGTVSEADAASVQVRVLPYGGSTGAALVDWTDVELNDGAYTGTLTVPQGGWYQLEARALDAEGNVLVTASDTNKWGVGINILCIGQSNMVGQGAAPYTVANDLVANCKSGTWSHLADPYSGGGASLVPAMANKLVEELGLPIGIIPAAVSGTGLHVAHKNHTSDRYWMNYNTANPADTSTLYGQAITKAGYAGGVELLVWNQGETDGYMGVTEEEYEADMKLLLERFRQDLGNDSLPMFLCQIGTHDPTNFDDAVYTGIRNAQHDLDDGVNFFMAATEMEFERKDTAHYTTPGLNEIGKRVANGILYYYGLSDYYRGPYISSACYADGSGTVIDVKITHRGGTDITSASEKITGFSVLDGDTEVTVNSAVRLNSDTIRLTLASAVTDLENTTVRYLYGLNPDVSSVAKDNTALRLPLENTTAGIPVTQVWNLSNTTMDDYTANWKVVQGKSSAGAVTQEDGYVTIVKTDDDEAALGNPGPYIWLVPKTAIDLPTDKPFTVEVTARMGSQTTANKTAEISARIGLNSNDTNGKLYPVYIKYGTEGWISTKSDGSNAVTLDTTLWHNYGLVVDHTTNTYDVYVDGELTIQGASASTYKGGELLRMGLDSEARGDMDIQSVRVGEGDLKAYLSAAVNAPETEPEEKIWDILDHDFAPQWDSEGIRKSSKTGTITQGDTYVNILKPDTSSVSGPSLYHWVISPAGLSLPRDGFTMETTVRVAGSVSAQANEISVRMGQHSEDLNGKIASVFLGYGEKGYISANGNGTGPYCVEMDTTVWHKLTFVVFQDDGAFYYDLYIDDVLTFDTVPFQTYKGGDLVRFGADNSGRCNLDVMDVHVGTGAILPEGASQARITGITLSETTQKESEEKTVTVTLEAPDFEDGRTVTVSLLDKEFQTVEGVSASGTFQDGKAQIRLTVPKGMKANNYYFYAVSQGRTALSGAYQVTVDREAPVFPTFEPVGFTIELEDYLYNPTQEFNFPTVVDTKDHPVENSMGQYRYYLFYAPHDAPAGCCVAVSNSLDGPWIEYAGNPVVSKTWDGNYSVSHVSSPWVMWNDVYDCWFMYFHGENNVTRYATSDDLLNWTYGGTCVYANDFSPSGSGFNEASYARVFEHEVPGLGNKYIMLLMITGTGSGGHRNIYWAHSEDGKEWTAVQTSLLDPTMDAEYKGNFSGPWFMEWDGRYFVICHASSGNMYAFEVGESLDEVIPWGVFYNSKDSTNPDNVEDESAYPDYGRSGAPCFIQDDYGDWHMFYEGGRRLHANIVHAVSHTHNWGEWEVTTPAGCTTDGLLTRTCHCGEQETQAIPATGHDFGDWTVETAPTCTEGGVEKRVCKNCDAAEIRLTEALGHQWQSEYTVDKEPTCTEDGSKSRHCERCDATTDTQVIEALGHSYHDGKCDTCGAADPKQDVETPSTADGSHLLLWTCWMLISACLLLGSVVLYQKRKRAE